MHGFQFNFLVSKVQDIKSLQYILACRYIARFLHGGIDYTKLASTSANNIPDTNRIKLDPCTDVIKNVFLRMLMGIHIYNIKRMCTCSNSLSKFLHDYSVCLSSFLLL